MMYLISLFVSASLRISVRLSLVSLINVVSSRGLSCSIIVFFVLFVFVVRGNCSR